jgi:hypothetical protein
MKEPEEPVQEPVQEESRLWKLLLPLDSISKHTYPTTPEEHGLIGCDLSLYVFHRSRPMLSGLRYHYNSSYAN